jgi:hypothetical protein
MGSIAKKTDIFQFYFLHKNNKNYRILTSINDYKSANWALLTEFLSRQYNTRVETKLVKLILSFQWWRKFEYRCCEWDTEKKAREVALMGVAGEMICTAKGATSFSDRSCPAASYCLLQLLRPSPHKSWMAIGEWSQYSKVPMPVFCASESCQMRLPEGRISAVYFI